MHAFSDKSRIRLRIASLEADDAPLFRVSGFVLLPNDQSNLAKIVHVQSLSRDYHVKGDRQGHSSQMMIVHSWLRFHWPGQHQWRPLSK